MRLDLFCKQISLTMIIFDRNEGDCREKNYVSIENYNTTLWNQILVLFIVFEVLLYACKPDFIMNSSNFLKYLTTLQTKISNCLPPFWSEITKNKDCPWTFLEETIPGQQPNFRALNLGFISPCLKDLLQTLGTAHNWRPKIKIG